MSDKRQVALEKLPADHRIANRPAAPLPPLGRVLELNYDCLGPMDEDEEALDWSALRRWMQAVRKRKLLVILITLLTTAAVAFGVYQLRSTFQATAIIEVSKEKTALVKAGDIFVESDDPVRSKVYMLQSPLLHEEVVVNQRLDENAAFLQTQDRWPLSALKRLVAGGSTDGEFDHNAATVDTSNLLPDGFTRRTPEESRRLEPFVTVIERHLTVENPKDTRLLRISYAHTDPVIAANVANGLAQIFIERSNQSRIQKYSKAAAWIEQTTRDLKDKAEQAERALVDFSKQNGIAIAEGQDAITVEKLTRQYAEALRAESDRVIKQSLYEEVQRGRVAEVPEAFVDPKAIELQKRLDELIAMASNLSAKYGPENPQIVAIKKQIAATEEQLRANHSLLAEKVKTDYERAVRDERAMKSSLSRARGEAVNQSQKVLQYNLLKEEANTTRGLYVNFLQKTGQGDFEAAEQLNNLYMITPARPPKSPMGPSRWMLILLGFTLSLIGSAGLAILLDRMDDTVKNVEDVSRYLQLPALGVIPAVAGMTARPLGPARPVAPAKLIDVDTASPETTALALPALANGSVAAEAYRVVRTSMMLSAEADAVKTILVTSSQPGEGKTTTVVNIGISLAQLGASVLVIDADLRTPSVHQVVGAQAEPGLSDYLAHTATLERIIQRVKVANLSLIAAGSTARKPADLISSKQMKGMLEELAPQYDHILIDSPPLINLADPILLSAMVDGVILVVRGGKSHRAAVRAARQGLESVGANILGVVLNDADAHTDGYGYYGLPHTSHYYRQD